MSQRSVFLFGLAMGAWLNIWPALIGDWWSIVFAYTLVMVCLWSVAFDPIRWGRRK